MSTSRTRAGGSVLKNSGEQLNGSPVKGATESAENERPLSFVAQNMPNPSENSYCIGHASAGTTRKTNGEKLMDASVVQSSIVIVDDASFQIQIVHNWMVVFCFHGFTSKKPALPHRACITVPHLGIWG